MSKAALIEQIEKALISIKPYLEADGGDVRVLDVDQNNVVTLELLGSCGSCPMSSMTMKAGIEEAIKRELPQITAVEAINLTEPDDPNAKLPTQMQS
jgi:Fe-S cluster biogenesis protein NfuA